MLAFENQNIEFKQEYVPDIRKEVIGFANAESGTVYVALFQGTDKELFRDRKEFTGSILK